MIRYLECGVLVLALMLAVPTLAQDVGDGHDDHPTNSAHAETERHADPDGEHSTHEADGDHTSDGHAALKNSVGLFLGVTDETGHDLEGTWGLEYVRLVAPRWALGGVVEYAGGDLRNTVFIAFAAWLPWSNLEILAGPGVEHRDGRPGGADHMKSGGAENSGDDNHFVFRLGVGWHFHLSHRIGLVPAAYLDLVEGEQVWVYGLNLTYLF